MFPLFTLVRYENAMLIEIYYFCCTYNRGINAVCLRLLTYYQSSKIFDQWRGIMPIRRHVNPSGAISK